MSQPIFMRNSYHPLNCTSKSRHNSYDPPSIPIPPNKLKKLTKTCLFQNKIMHVYNRSQLQWSIVQEWLYFGDEDPETVIEVRAISWENPPK